jgi:hypothetical protein
LCPTGRGGGARLLSVAVFGAALFTGLKIFAMGDDVGEEEFVPDIFEQEKIIEDSRTSMSETSSVSILSSLAQQARFTAAALALHKDIALTKLHNILPTRKEILPSSTWSPCVFEGRTLLDRESGVWEFSFGFESARQTLGLEFGEAVTLMALDDTGKKHSVEVVPSSSRSKLGSFQVVLKEGGKVSGCFERFDPYKNA